jgi:hypothetical protein
LVPPAYTGQEAAALLFGGLASDYAISTNSSSENEVNNYAWVSTWGGVCGSDFPCGTQVAENFKVSSQGLYQNPGDTSAYVEDWAIGGEYRNYAFRIVQTEVPVPGTLALLGLGMFGLAALRSRKTG